MIMTGCDMSAYYGWFIERRFGLKLNGPVRGSHVTFISDKFEDRTAFDEAAALFEGKDIKFFVDPEPRSNGEHWWLRAYSPEAESIREVAGLSREPYFTFHLTIGYANERNIDHSMYVLRQCQKFELITNSSRMPLDEHEVLRF